MKEVKPNVVGLALGIFAALVHALWSLLVASGFAKPFMDFVFGLHFLENPYVMLPFDLMTALILVIFAFVAGFVAGWTAGYVWNWAVKKK